MTRTDYEIRAIKMRMAADNARACGRTHDAVLYDHLADEAAIEARLA